MPGGPSFSVRSLQRIDRANDAVHARLFLVKFAVFLFERVIYQ